MPGEATFSWYAGAEAWRWPALGHEALDRSRFRGKRVSARVIVTSRTPMGHSVLGSRERPARSLEPVLEGRPLVVLFFGCVRFHPGAPIRPILLSRAAALATIVPCRAGTPLVFWRVPG